MKPKPKKTPPPENVETDLDAVILLMISGQSDAQLRETIPAATGRPLDRRILDQMIGDARRKITLAADYARDEQIGIAIKRLNDLYRRSLKGQDYKTGISCQKELNKLMGLYQISEAETPDEPSETDETLDQIRAHLIPLALAPDDYPLAEHARIAAERIREIETPPPPVEEEKPKKPRRKKTQ